MRQQNFHKNPHTDRFLQTFHSGIGSNGRNYRQEMGVEAEERTATEFVGGAFGRDYSTTSTEFFHHLGYKVRTGAGLVSEAQAKWIIDIAEKSEGVSDEMVKSLSVRLEQGFARAAASAFITKYKDLPRKAVETTAAQINAGHAGPGTDATIPVRDAQGVRAGRYALVHTDGIKFYRITEGKGRWAGRTFIEAQASDDHYPIRNAEARQTILAAIAENPLEAEQRYGRELGHCSRCGRTLTDETSRAYGIGPDCRSKY
jgi:hypothetical protein